MMSAARRRMAVALVAVPGLFVSLYLLLYKLGIYGSLVCGQGGSCSVVQASSYARFLGVPVAGWGAAWYVAVLGVALWGSHVAGTGADSPAGGGSSDSGGSGGGASGLLGPAAVLLALAVGGFLFSAYLTWVELFVIEAICRWCLVSAGLSTVIMALAAPEAGRVLDGTGKEASRASAASPG